MLVQADRQHPRIVVEGGLYPVGVVHVDVDVGDPLGSRQEQPGDSDRRVVVHAEPARAAADRVMQAASDARAMPRRAGPHCPGGGQRGTGHQRRRVVHAREYRVVLGAQAETQHRRARLRAARPPAAPRRCSAAGAPSPVARRWPAPGARPTPRPPRTRRRRGPARSSARPAPAPSDGRTRSHNPPAGSPRQHATYRPCTTQARRGAAGNSPPVTRTPGQPMAASLPRHSLRRRIPHPCMCAACDRCRTLPGRGVPRRSVCAVHDILQSPARCGTAEQPPPMTMDGRRPRQGWRRRRWWP